jgi:hypothetical protein
MPEVVWPPPRPDLAFPGLGACPSARCKGLPPCFLRLRSGSGFVQPGPREAPFRLHTPVWPPGRGTAELFLKP